ncbi:MAG: Holliday junction DNA helicase RuvA [Parcubacteria group bacterium CG1_02_37_51]|uniref:Holliday junction branch migration complex subunit RuvA n=2 Tax=Candidatus Komeiliibacteriota TaxID=1817908 RepID=A0A2M8DSI3_9BACT|nr:MAG: Holliday junction DNA helicase RuvA [Parcubacteria group bacterium CG1_02_37_51]PIY95298.1 MAG: Holliday junction branch migration protein RuvA [Candidatus Komeilibacteria bacterium CG_4_10_14_0_8_um_filter_37_78]PJC02314.1 MAG: Holliday junction branch migration protein RuvA [Candidatus Komeilibacteria bacterium CG_4_9_14_0_8_um_filter_36_9]
MISYIKGTIKYKTDKYIILENNQIGYKISVPEILLAGLKEDAEIELYTHQYVKEDALDLYGFASIEELNFFQHLISISGVGPKSGLAVLSIAKISDIQQAILKGDPTLLKKVSGIGTKTAERIVVELKNKVGAMSGADLSTSNSDLEIIDALEALGYKMPEIRAAVRELPSDITDTQAQIKAILKIINHNK